jgi:hypothetical protein
MEAVRGQTFDCEKQVAADRQVDHEESAELPMSVINRRRRSVRGFASRKFAACACCCPKQSAGTGSIAPGVSVRTSIRATLAERQRSCHQPLTAAANTCATVRTSSDGMRHLTCSTDKANIARGVHERFSNVPAFI